MNTRTWLYALAMALAAAFQSPTPAAADDIYIRSGKSELAVKGATVRLVKDGIVYYTISGRDSHRELADVSRIESPGEADFNTAEKAFAEAQSSTDEATGRQKYADAVAGYQKSLANNKQWIKDVSTLRLQVAAPKSGRFDAAVGAWMSLVAKDPAAAMKAKPSTAGIDPKSAYLANAAKTLQAAIGSATSVEIRRAYLDLLGDVQTAMDDQEGALKTNEARVALGGSPEEIASVAVKLSAIDISRKNFDSAAARMAKVDLNVLPEAQKADALYVIAESKGAKLTASSSPETLKDAALDYMRLVAGYPAGPQAGSALLKVAQIHEWLKEPETALKLCQQLIKEYPGTPAAQEAQKFVDRLGKSAKAS